MKTFLKTLKGKIILGVAAAAVVIAATAITIVVVKSPKFYRSIKVEELNGTTTIAKGQNEEEIAYEGMNLKSGDKVMVEADSNMTLLFDADKYMFADAGTKFTVEASGNSKKNNTKTRIILEEGSVLCRIDKKLSDNETYEVETPNSVMSVRGTIFRMTIYKNEKGEKVTKVDVLEGAVKVDLPGDEGTEGDRLIEAGQAGIVSGDEENMQFEMGESDISYEDFSEPMAQFVVNTVDKGREICIGKDLFVHYTGLENHPESETVTKEATCKEEGEKEVYCSTCEMVVRVEPVPKKEHTPGEWGIEEEAPCVERLRCSECNEIMEERELSIELHKTERITEETKDGCDVHTVLSDVCTVCGVKKEVSVTDTKEHTYGDWQVTTPATCTAAGVRQMVCSVCGNTESENVAATGHSYGGWNTVKDETCTETGLEEKVCSSCGNKETRIIGAAGHSYVKMSEVAATCTEAGEIKQKCSDCGDIVTSATPALGHSVTYHHDAYSIPYDNSFTFTVDYVGSCERCYEDISRVEHSGTWVRSEDNPAYVDTTCQCGHTSLESH